MSTCVEARITGDRIEVRNSAEVDGLVVMFTFEQWCSLLDALVKLHEAGLTFTVGGAFSLESPLNPGRIVYFSQDDWQLFAKGVLAGEFWPENMS